MVLIFSILCRKIVYVSILGPVIIAAFLEWFLWLAAFLYCLGKVFVKADHWSIKVLAVIMMVMFTAFRYVLLSGFSLPGCPSPC